MSIFQLFYLPKILISLCSQESMFHTLHHCAASISIDMNSWSISYSIRYPIHQYSTLHQPDHRITHSPKVPLLRKPCKASDCSKNIVTDLFAMSASHLSNPRPDNYTQLFYTMLSRPQAKPGAALQTPW